MRTTVLTWAFILFFNNYVFSQILAQKDGFNFTYADFQKEIRFIEFAFNQSLTNEDIELLKKSEIEAFYQNPQQVLSDINALDQQMQQLYALTDPLQIGLAQDVLIYYLYQQMQITDDSDIFKQLFNKYVKVLAVDDNLQLAYTQADVDAYFNYLEFIYSLYDMNVSFDQQTRETYTPSFVNYFLYSDQQTKASLAAMDVIADFYIYIYQSLSEQEKQQFKQSLIAQTSYNQNNYDNYGTYDNYGYNDNQQNKNYTKEELDQIMSMMMQKQQMNNMLFNTMNNIMMQSHAATSNIISNIGSGDTYWDVVDY